MNFWDTVEFPLVGEFEPASAAYMPEWAAVDSDVVPDVAQPVKIGLDSKPPLVITFAPATAVTDRTKVVLCVADVPVPVTVMV